MTTYCLKGPDVAAIGWIPRYEDQSDLPTGPHYERSVAMRVVFNSGNPAPSTNFNGFTDFDNWLDATKEYRGVLYIRDVMLRYSDEDPIPKIDYGAEKIVGFTPPRIIIARRDIRLRPLRGYVQGYGAHEKEPEDEDGPMSDNSGSWIKLRVQFKPSYWMDGIGRALTGHWAPNAWMEIYYRIYKNGSVEIDFKGSAIPSQAYYVNWNSLSQRDMEYNTETEIREFIETTEGCTKAPGVSHFRHDAAGDTC